MKNSGGETIIYRASVQISTIAIVNELISDFDKANTEIKIAGGGTIKCKESYDAINFLLQLSSDSNQKETINGKS